MDQLCRRLPSLVATAVVVGALSACASLGGPGATPMATPPNTDATASHAPGTLAPTPVSAGTPMAIPTPAILSADAQMLNGGTSEILSCDAQGGMSCMNVVLLLDEWGGAISTLDETPAVRTDGVAAHGLALQMFDAYTPAQVSALAPQFLGAINQLRSDFDLSALSA